MKIFPFICALFFLFTLAHGDEKTSQKPSQVVVIVHGSWGGGWDYKEIESLLEDKGYTVYRPTLTGLGEREHLNGPHVNLDTHILDIVNLLKFEELYEVILVGHSYAGMIITGVAHRTPERIKHLIYMDALLPVHGESVFSLMEPKKAKMLRDLAANSGETWEIPPFWGNWGKDVPQPTATYTQPISLGNMAAEKIQATYVLTVEPGETTDEFSRYAKRAKERDWHYHELPTGHNVHRTMPNEYAEIILRIK